MIDLTSCQSARNNSALSSTTIYIYQNQLEKDTIVKKDTLFGIKNPKEVITYFNSKEIGFYKIKMEFNKMSNDTLYISIPNSLLLTQQMGTTGAFDYMIETTFSLTDFSYINYVNYDFEIGDHAAPGTYSKKYYWELFEMNKEYN